MVLIARCRLSAVYVNAVIIVGICGTVVEYGEGEFFKMPEWGWCFFRFVVVFFRLQHKFMRCEVLLLVPTPTLNPTTVRRSLAGDGSAALSGGTAADDSGDDEDDVADDIVGGDVDSGDVAGETPMSFDGAGVGAVAVKQNILKVSTYTANVSCVLQSLLVSVSKPQTLPFTAAMEYNIPTTTKINSFVATKGINTNEKYCFLFYPPAENRFV